MREYCPENNFRDTVTQCLRETLILTFYTSSQPMPRWHTRLSFFSNIQRSNWNSFRPRLTLKKNVRNRRSNYLRTGTLYKYRTVACYNIFQKKSGTLPPLSTTIKEPWVIIDNGFCIILDQYYITMNLQTDSTK